MKQIEVIPGLDFEDVLQQMKDDEVVLTRNGHAVALLTELDDDELYWRKRESDPEFIASLVRAREQVARGETTKLEDIERELGIE